MNELRDLPIPLKESSEIHGVDGLGIFSPELTLQEANDKVAARIDERLAVEESTEVGMSSSEQSKMRNMMNEACTAQSKANLLEQEWNSLKRKRDRETDPKKKSELDRELAAKKSKLKKAKEDFEDKDKAYKNYVRLIHNREMHRNLF